MCDDLGIPDKPYVLVWKIKLNGSWIITDNIKDIAVIVENDSAEMIDENVGEKITIQLLKMSTKKYESLPEFDGY
jgi:hypothetical protein